MRAVEKLRRDFFKRGINVSTAALSGAVLTRSVQAAPVALAKSVTAVAVAKGAAASTSTLTLIQGALKIMAWTKAKTAIVTAAAVILAAGVTTSVIVHDVHQKRAMASQAELTEAGNGAYGLYIHYGITTFANPGEKGTIPAARFAPASLDVPSWAHAAKQAGMTFAVLTAKHESGFGLWHSQDYGYDTGGSPFKGDIIADFITACKAEGIAPGVHYSIPDEFNEGAIRYRGAVSPAYFDIIKKHVAELHTLYPDLRVQIFDMSERLSQAQFDELRQLVKRLNPQCIVWGTVKGQAPNHDSDTVIASWMWSPDARLNQAQSLFGHYQQSQKAKKAFVLNVAPDRSGRIPDDQLAVLAQVKKLIN
jgi:alpha-L-fucosidase